MYKNISNNHIHRDEENRYSRLRHQNNCKCNSHVNCPFLAFVIALCMCVCVTHLLRNINGQK